VLALLDALVMGRNAILARHQLQTVGELEVLSRPHSMDSASWRMEVGPWVDDEASMKGGAGLVHS
jgi:hypothetical protein